MDRNDMVFEILQNLEKKLDKGAERLVRIQSDLNYHIRRTDLLEQQVSEKFNRPTLRQIAAVTGILAAITGIVIRLLGEI
tara:strand:+ start:631 stop:870 length:240 start_codon:yes stop_codon:yes gene_type:complete